MPKAMGIPICFGGGILGGAFNVGGPPIVAYVYSQNWSKTKTVALLQTVFFSSGIVRNGLMWFEGDTTFKLLSLVFFSLPFVLIGIWLGKIVLERTPLHWLKRIVFSRSSPSAFTTWFALSQSVDTRSENSNQSFYGDFA